MRLKLILSPDNNSKLFPFNYNYHFSSAIYKLLQFGSPEFSEFLHESGYKIEGKSYKLFTFALEFSKKPFIIDNMISLREQKIYLHISSPLISGFIENFVMGTLHKGLIDIQIENLKLALYINEVTSLAEPEIKSEVKIHLLSPMVLSAGYFENEKIKEKYLLHTDNINTVTSTLNKNLINKFQLIHNQKYEGDLLKFNWDQKYINDRSSKNQKVTRKISIIKSGLRPVEIKANMIPFYLDGNPELIKVGLDTGFGAKNSMGFGMGEIRN
jgi:CRISPR-associated endoribonuclease Cas6